MGNKKRVIESSKLSNAYRLLARFLTTHKNYVMDIRRLSLYNDEPKLFAYGAFYKTNSNDPENSASGVSFNKKKALVRVLGEIVERYCLDDLRNHDFIIRKLSDNNTSFLNPTELSPFSKQQLLKESYQKFVITRKSKFRWIKGYSCPEIKDVFIPAQLVFTSYRSLKEEPWIRYPISTGAAANVSVENALYNGICEIVERDGFMVHYLNRLSTPKIDLASLKDKSIYKILTIFKRYRLNLVVLDISTDIQIPAFAAITLDKTGIGPAVSVGLKAGFNIKDTIIGAIEEALMVRSWIRDKFIYSDTIYKLPQIIRTVDDRAYFWFKPESIKFLDFWLKNNNLKKIKMNDSDSDPKYSLGKALTLLNKACTDVFYVDITDPKMKGSNLVVVKVIIPQLHPLYLNEECPYLGGKRLYQVPVRLGYQKVPKKEGELNKIPHPFL